MVVCVCVLATSILVIDKQKIVSVFSEPSQLA
jgi:hypothetical protein